jgi:hypothetical protein
MGFAMATDFREIELTDEQKRRIAKMADATGQPWSEVIDQQLSALQEASSAMHQGRYIRDREKRLAHFRRWLVTLKSHNPNFDDSRESIYF